MQGLANLAGVSQIMFGTDYPFGNGASVAADMRSVGFTDAQLRAIDRDNALRILPQYG
jgi:predicted TIM-barrel fold metal-dependent hydrolase